MYISLWVNSNLPKARNCWKIALSRYAIPHNNNFVLSSDPGASHVLEFEVVFQLPHVSSKFTYLFFGFLDIDLLKAFITFTKLPKRNCFSKLHPGWVQGLCFVLKINLLPNSSCS